VDFVGFITKITATPDLVSHGSWPTYVTQNLKPLDCVGVSTRVRQLRTVRLRTNVMREHVMLAEADSIWCPSAYTNHGLRSEMSYITPDLLTIRADFRLPSGLAPGFAHPTWTTMYWLSVLSVLTVVPLGFATPPSPCWDDMRLKHSWDSIPEKWECQGHPPAGTTIDLRVALKPHRKNALIDALYEVSDPSHSK
jgi:hypothetical protein